VRWAALVLAALALTGCETTAEKSAKLERVAKQHKALAQHGLSITKLSTKVKVIETAVLSSPEGAAALVKLRNLSGTALSDVPIEITVTDPSGASIYSNNAPGLAPALVSVPLLPAHGRLTWIDDQLPLGGQPRSVSARLGEGQPAPAKMPTLNVEATSLSGQSAGEPEAEGRVVNHSTLAQHEVVVYALARRAGRTVAAGRAVLPQVPAGASTRFQLYFIGDPRGAQLQFTAVCAAA